jgi:hypothetical protein
MELIKNTAVIIRSSGERTEGLCRYAIEKNGVPKENIHFVKNVKPFSQALKTGYELAIDLDKKYTFFIDADMVVMEDALSMMLQIAERLPSNTFFFNPLTFDCFSGAIVPGGVHLYRNKYICKILENVRSEAITKRPETHAVKKFSNEDEHKIVFLDIPVGFHEFEQYYKDIFGRVVNKMQKTGNARGILTRIANDKNEFIGDLYVIKKAVEFAKGNKTKFNLLAGEFDDIFSKECDLEEKKPILEKNFDILLASMKLQSESFVLRGYTAQLLIKESVERKSIFKKIITRLT